MTRARLSERADGEIQIAIDWVDNAFGEIEREVATWRPLGWLGERASRLAAATTPRRPRPSGSVKAAAPSSP